MDDLKPVPCDSCVKKCKCGHEDWQRLNHSLMRGLCEMKPKSQTKEKQGQFSFSFGTKSQEDHYGTGTY